MTTGQVIVTVALLSRMYGVDPAVMDCMVYRESSYNVAAVNGIHRGPAQWNPNTRDWLDGKAREDALWLHGDIGQGPVYDLALMAWAVSEGYGPLEEAAE